ncbi:hypothetical protein KQX54_016032 [Cotesia glomerata]|uniref:Uncharacterized protein n=1 Tax=Cotesia glomerata TaxID=32391 RepID=A0AAV7HW42_COTGL|nr:hypothetical protein KQX54_016032 [Cotesia glomerata]
MRQERVPETSTGDNVMASTTPTTPESTSTQTQINIIISNSGASNNITCNDSNDSNEVNEGDVVLTSTSNHQQKLALNVQTDSDIERDKNATKSRSD